MKKFLRLLLAFGVVGAALVGASRLNGAEQREWRLKAGGKIHGELIGMAPGGQVVLKKTEDGRAYRIPMSYLIKEDQDLLKPFAEIERLKGKGLIEFSSKEMNSFPEKFDGKLGWIDGEFQKVDSEWLEIERIGSRQFLIGFEIYRKDDSPAHFHRFVADKKVFGELLLKLKPGDPLRVEAKAGRLGTREIWLTVNSISALERPVKKPANP